MSNDREVFWKGVKQIEADVDEHCRFDPIDNGSQFPNYRFEVRTEYARTNDLVSLISIQLKPDQELWQYIITHPQWRKDPRLLLLMNIYEILWKLKLFPTELNQPFQTEIIIKPLQGGTLEVAIVAEVFIDFGGVHVISAVNYANTHVRDQVDAVIKQNPDAAPTAEYSQYVLRRTQNARIDAKRQKAKEQRRQLKARQKSNASREPVKIFIDESGDIGFKSLNEPYVLTAYAIPASAAKPVEDYLTRILANNWATPPRELHFNKVPATKLASVQAAIAQCLRYNGARCVSVIGHKSGFLAYLLRCEAETRRIEEKPIITNWAYLLERSPTGLARATLILILEELLVHLATETLDIQTTTLITHDQKHRDWMNEALKIAFKRSQAAIKNYSVEMYGRELPLVRSFKIADSAKEPSLWVCDWICWELARWCKGTEWSQSLQEHLDAISFITFDHLSGKVLIDRPGGRVISAYPDLPRRVDSI